MQKNNKWENKESELERAKALIEQFCQEEYDEHADFSDLENIGVAYTTLIEDEVPIQVSVDLIHYCVKYFLNGKFLRSRQYKNLGEFIHYELETLDFDELICEVSWEERIESLIEEVINRLDISRESLSKFLGKDENFISRVEKGEDDLTDTMFDSLCYLSTYSASFPKNLTLEEIKSVATIGRIVYNLRKMNNILQEPNIKTDC